MNRMGKLKNHFASSLIHERSGGNHGMVGAFSLLGLGVFLLIQDRAVNRQLALRGESMAQSLARELQFSLLVGDRGETRRLLESYANEDVLFLEVLNAAGRRVCGLAHRDRAGRMQEIPAPAAGAVLGRPLTTVRHVGQRFVEIRVPVLAPAHDGCSTGRWSAGIAPSWAHYGWGFRCRKSALSSARCWSIALA